MLKYVKETFKNSAIYGLGNISVKLVGFILIPFLTDPKYLSVNDYGALGVLEAINQILVIVMGLGLYNSMFRWFYEQKEDDRKATFFTALTVTTLMVGLILGIVFIWQSDLTELFFSSQEYKSVLVLAFISTGLQAVTIVPATLMRLQDKAAFFTSSNLVKLVVTLIATLYFLLWDNGGITAIYYGQIAGFITYIVLIIPYLIKNSSFNIHIPVFTEMLGYGSTMMFAGISAASVNVLDRFVLNSMSGLEEVGLYSLGYKVSSILKVFVIGSVSMALTPLIFRKINDKDSSRFYSKTMTYYGFGMMLCIIAVSLFSKEAIKFFTSSKVYWTSFSVIPILAFSLYFSALKDVVVTGLHITKKTSRISLVTAIISCLNLGLNFLLIPFLGAEGAALASLISQSLFFIGLFYFSNKEYHIPFEWFKVILILVVGAVLVSLALLVNEYSLFIRLSIKSLALILFPFVLYPFGFYEEGEIVQIKTIWKNWRNPLRWKSNLERLFS
ncbi:MAG: polysaccharide biosynthesis C-terminal domain-containing protein [Balneolaceae bacterium]